MAQGAPAPGPAALLPTVDRSLSALAWRAWLTLGGRSLGSEALDAWLVDEFCLGLPPWLDSRPWLVLGLAAGLPLGLALLLGLWLCGWSEPLVAGVALVVPPAYLAGALSRRDRRGEVALDFPRRLAVTLMHLPGLLAGALLSACAGVALLAVAPDRPAAALVPACLPLLLLIQSIRGTTPRVFARDFGDGDVWPPLGDLDSLGARVLAALAMLGGAGVTVFSELLPAWVGGPLALAGLAQLLGLRVQERLADQLAAAIERWPHAREVGRREWVRRRWEPEPYEFEARLLARPGCPRDWELAHAYAAARAYDAEQLAQAAARVWRGAQHSEHAARAAALCALALWTHRDAGVAQAHRGLAQLDTIAAKRPAVLDESFWRAFDAAVADSPRRAEGLSFLLARRERLRLSPAAAWRQLHQLGWTRALAAAPESVALRLLDEVLDLLAEARAVAVLEGAWSDWEAWRESYEGQGGETLARRWSSRALELLELTLGQRAPLPPAHAAGYALALRALALRAATGDEAALAQWYREARAFEARPTAAQREQLSAWAWLSLWRQVGAAIDDPEETLRQEEHYRVAKSRG